MTPTELLRSREKLIAEYTNRLDQLFMQEHTYADIEHELGRLLNDAFLSQLEPQAMSAEEAREACAKIADGWAAPCASLIRTLDLSRKEKA